MGRKAIRIRPKRADIVDRDPALRTAAVAGA